MDESNLVQVELIANPAVTRTMSRASYNFNKNKWRLAGEEPQPVIEKKKDVEPVADNHTTLDEILTQVPGALEKFNTDMGQMSVGKGLKLVPITEAGTAHLQDGEVKKPIDIAREAYFEKFGTLPQKNITLSRLNKMINE